MSKRKKNKRKVELVHRKQRELQAMQSTFIDADVFINALVNEKSPSFAYFESFRGKNHKVITSTHTLGEVVKFLYRLASEEAGYDVDKSIHVFKSILDTVNMLIVNFGENTHENIEKIYNLNERIQFKDALNLAVAYEAGCNKFCTFDTGINKETLSVFGIQKIEP